jgi:large subunit ribosomal protein L24
MKIQRGDSVVVVTGDQAGPTPHRVNQVLDGGRKLVVESINRVFKHVRRGHPKSPQGGRLNLEMPIDASNVQFYCDGCKKPTRIGFRYTDDGRKERFCRKCGAAAGSVSPPRAKYAKQK